MSVNEKVIVPEGNSATTTPILDPPDAAVNQANQTAVTCLERRT